MANIATSGIASALITASASIVVAVAVLIVNQLKQRRDQKRQAALDRVNLQLRELYGPLMGLVAVNEHVWAALRRSELPDRDQRRAASLNEHQQGQWEGWLHQALMPANVKMRDLIVQHTDLVVEDEVPQTLLDFCAHVASYEVFLARPDNELIARALVDHPGRKYVTYTRSGFASLKAKQGRLLAGARPE